MIENKRLVQRPVINSAGDGLVIFVGAVRVIDRGDYIPFACEVLAQVAHEITIARISVRNDDERHRSIVFQSNGIPNSSAVQGCYYGEVARCRGISTAGYLAICELGGIPDFDREIAIVIRRITAFNGIQNVNLVRVGELQRSHADVVLSEVCESRSIVPDDVDAITLR